MGRLTLFLLGPPHIEYKGEPIQVNTRKAVALFAYLALTDQVHTRDALATLLWPESGQARARANLRQTLSALKKALGGEWLEIGREHLALRRGPGLWVDADRFRDRLATCRTHGHPEDKVCGACLPLLAEAVDLYRGDFMTGFTLRDSPGFDEWQLFVSDQLRREMTNVLERLVRGHSSRGEFAPAIAHAQRLLALDPLHEPAHRRLIQLYTQSGQRAAALRQYETCVQVLERELKVPPQEETTRLHQAILESPSSSAPSRPVHSHNLPHQTTPLIGREEELAEIGRLLEGAQCRLLTLTGPGGIGKTHLAIQAASERLRAFPDGVFFIPLAALSSTDALVPTIANAFKFSFHGSKDPRLQLLDYLRDKAMLLVLDNLEHLLEGAELLGEVLQSAAEVKLLTTSRERLNVKGEWVIEMQGLEYPQAADDEVEQYSAIQLFVQCARRTYPAFELAEKAHVVRICRLVGGLPLAIELAAAWTRALPCAEIAREIERNLDFLATSQRDIPERHRSLRVAFEYSWGLLSEEEKRVFRMLSVFRGGFTRDAAQAVANVSLDVLSDLMDKSFVRRTGKRYEILESLRQYAEEKRAGRAIEDRQTRERHCRYFADFLHRQEQALKAHGQAQALQEIGADIENIHLAWKWMVHQHELEQIERCLESLYRFYDMRGQFQQGERFFARTVQDLHPSGERSTDLGRCASKLLARQGRFHEYLGNLDQAQELLGKSLLVLLSLGETADAAFCVTGLANIAVYRPERATVSDLQSVGQVSIDQSDRMQSRDLYQQALSLYRQAGDRWGEADVLWRLGDILVTIGEYAKAERCAQQSLAVSRDLGDLWGEGIAFNLLGTILAHKAQYAEAIACAEQALIISREINDLWIEGWGLRLWAYQLVHAGDYTRAKTYAEQALGVSTDTNDVWSQGYALACLGTIYHRQQDYTRAEAHYRQALGVLGDIGDQHGQSRVFCGLGDISIDLGDYDDAIAYYEQALKASRKAGARPQESLVATNLGVVFGELGDYATARDHIQRALQIQREIGDQQGMSVSLAYLGWLYLQLGDSETAREYCHQAQQLVDALGDRRVRAEVFTYLGHTLIELSEPDEAGTAYQQALNLQRELDQHHLAIAPLAGLAHVSLVQENSSQARSYVKEILDYLDTLDGIRHPFQIYLTSYRVLQTNRSPRAREVLSTAYDLLQERAARITDEEMRRSFLENVPSHREVVHEFAQHESAKERMTNVRD